MHAKVSEGRLFTRAELDEIEPVRPLGVASGLHVLSLNTSGMHELGIFDLPDGPERVIHRDADGAPSGVVTEVFDRMPFVPAGEQAQVLREQIPILATQYGVTTVGSIAWNRWDADVLQGLLDEGVPLRMRSYWHVPRVAQLDDAIAAGIRSAESIPGSGVGGVKIFVDGQHGDGFDAVFDDLKWDQEELDRFVARASSAGIQVIMHAVSTTAVRMALTAIERCGAGPGNPLRHRIEHGGDYIETADIAWAAEVGALLLTTPQFIVSTDGESSGPGALLRSITDAGVVLFGGTDTTGTVPEGASPLFNIACTIHRAVDPHWQSDQRLDFDAAARLFTSSAAYAMFEEHTRGSLFPGAVGDLVVLDRAVDEIDDPARFFDLRVRTTVFAGVPVYGAEAAPSV